MIGSGFEERGEVDISSGAIHQHPSSGVSDRIDIRITNGIQKALHDLFARLFQSIVQDGDDPIGFGKNFVVEIHRSVFENVTLDSAKDLNPGNLFADFADIVPMLSQSGRIQSVGHADSL